MRFFFSPFSLANDKCEHINYDSGNNKLCVLCVRKPKTCSMTPFGRIHKFIEVLGRSLSVLKYCDLILKCKETRRPNDNIYELISPFERELLTIFFLLVVAFKREKPRALMIENKSHAETPKKPRNGLSGDLMIFHISLFFFVFTKVFMNPFLVLYDRHRTIIKWYVCRKVGLKLILRNLSSSFHDKWLFLLIDLNLMSHNYMFLNWEWFCFCVDSRLMIAEG